MSKKEDGSERRLSLFFIERKLRTMSLNLSKIEPEPSKTAMDDSRLSPAQESREYNINPRWRYSDMNQMFILSNF